MIKATLQSPAKRQPLALLLIGPPGGGKTTLALGFPAPYIADIDGNLDGPLRVAQKRNPALTYAYDRIGFLEDGSLVPLPQQWPRLLSCVAAAAKDPDVRTIIIDGLTHVDNILQYFVCAQQMKAEMDIALWRPFRRELMNAILTWRSTGKNFVMLCHEENVYRVDPKNMMKLDLERRVPAISSRISDVFGGLFTDMWRCQAYPGVGGRPTFKVTLTRTATDDLKNAYGEVGEVDVTTEGFSAVNKFLKLS